MALTLGRCGGRWVVQVDNFGRSFGGINLMLRLPKLLSRKLPAALKATPLPQACLELLEVRCLLTGAPTLAYNSTGILAYDHDTNSLDVQATPLSLAIDGGGLPALFTSSSQFQLHIKVDSSGNLIAGSGTGGFNL